ncbi:MAG: hypothetical protein JSR73_15250 [Proteobacteria bacterium]|nr:hypothetical protein [Pseudomonadota bacterium]
MQLPIGTRLPGRARACEGILQVLLPLAAVLVLLPAAAAPPSHPTTSPFRQQRESAKAESFYASRWGVDELRVRSTNGGALIRFTYRVVDVDLARALNDKRNTPSMISQRARVVLQVPVMEKVGPLRQSMPPEAGKDYWMVFSNKGSHVKPGDRVDVVIGSFHAESLLVE